MKLKFKNKNQVKIYNSNKGVNDPKINCVEDIFPFYEIKFGELNPTQLYIKHSKNEKWEPFYLTIFLLDCMIDFEIGGK